MRFIIVGLVAGLVTATVYFLVVPSRDRTFLGETFVLCIVGVCIGLGIYAGLAVNLGKYGPPEVDKTIELRSLYEDSDKYIRISPKNNCTYCMTEGDTYAFRTLDGNIVTIIEEENNTSPRLVKYVQKHEKNFWTFAVDVENVYYTFFIPKGSVIAGLSAS